MRLVQWVRKILTKTGSSSIATGLYGKAAGVRIQSAPGGSTGAISISVRGLSSITGNTQPLIIMDVCPSVTVMRITTVYWDNQRIESNGMWISTRKILKISPS